MFLQRFVEGPRRRDEVADLAADLEHLLGTREGYGAILRRFGLPAYHTMYGIPQMVEVLVDEIKRVIKRYEPRLKQVEIKALGLDADLWLHLELQALHGRERRRFLISLHTNLGDLRVRAA